MRTLARILLQLPLCLLSPFLLLVAAVSLAAVDLIAKLGGAKRPEPDKRPGTAAASIVIPNWNGRDLLAKYLPTVVAATAGHPDNEVIVVENGSSDGSAAFLKDNFPSVRVLELPRNLGFGGGCNAGVDAARNDIVVLLNSDMRVEPGFLAPLLEGFTDDKVFAVSCQIFFSDPERIREETGLTEVWWENGGIRLRHRIDPGIDRPFPCFYGGGGSCAFDRSKFLELGGFDSLLAPFYLEDTDLGYLAWKRGWKVLYQPASKVFHEHRGTIGRNFRDSYIQTILQKNFVLFCWKNIHEWRRLISHFVFSFAGACLSLLFGPSPQRTTFPGIWRAFGQLPAALRSRMLARRLARIDDTEAFLRPLGAYYRDRFDELDQQPDRLRVLFAAPYPICPPVHGGGVFMYQTTRQLLRHVELHLAAMLDYPYQEAPHAELAGACKTARFFPRVEKPLRSFASPVPHAVQEFRFDEFRWHIHRTVYLERIDVIQLEYLTMAQYGGRFQEIACLLFEHDLYFQSISRALPHIRGLHHKAKALYEYMRALRYELRTLPLFDRVQVCTADNRACITGYLPAIDGRVDDRRRAGIDVSAYPFTEAGREPNTMLFVGSFRHQPNLDALEWLITRVLPRVLQQVPGARLVVVGSDPPSQFAHAAQEGAIEFRGFVEDVIQPFSRCAVFVCPVLSGSGVRVKLIEAFAFGIPVVSTTVGAEGLANEDGEVCRLADDPADFADHIVQLFNNTPEAAAMARRARTAVQTHHDIVKLTEELVEDYRQILRDKRARI